MSRGWLTPDDLPSTLTCVRVFLPNGDEYADALRGALFLLELAYNWEQFGSETPADVAQLWTDANYQTYKWRPCVPAGIISHYGGRIVPDGYLKCDGSSYDPDDYPELFEAIGYNFGGSDPGDFDVPDLNDRYNKTTNDANGIGYTEGINLHSMNTNQMPAHSHTVDASIVLAAPGALPVYGPGALPLFSTNNTGGDGNQTNMPDTMRLLGIISTGKP